MKNDMIKGYYFINIGVLKEVLRKEFLGTYSAISFFLSNAAASGLVLELLLELGIGSLLEVFFLGETLRLPSGSR